MGCNGVLSHTPWWEPGLCLWCQVFLGWIRKQYPAETFGTTHKLLGLACGYSVKLSHCIWLCWHVLERERDRTGHEKGWRFGAVVPPVPPCAPDEGSMMEWCGGGGPWQHKDPLWSQWSGAQPCRGDPQSLEGKQRPSYEAAWERLGHHCHYYCHCPHHAWESCTSTAKEIREGEISRDKDENAWEKMRKSVQWRRHK